jgi:hypothetical protein
MPVEKNKALRFWILFFLASLFSAVSSFAAEDGIKPFKPYLSGQVGITSSGKPADKGDGQVTNDFFLSGTYNLTEAGDFLSAGFQGGRQKLEGGNSDYGGLSLQGGLGLGSFFPSLSLQAQWGTSALASYSAGLSGSFQLSDNFSLGLNLSGGFTTHQGPFLLLPITKVSTKNWGGGLSATFLPWDFLGLTLGLQQNYDVTYHVEDLSNGTEYSLNQTVRTPSVSLTADFTILTDFSLTLSGQRGQEFCPAGWIYLPALGRAVYFSQPTVEYFSGYSTSLSYNFQ